jgi:hypothetical protein
VGHVIQPVSLGIGSLVFINSIEYGVVNINVIIIKVFVLLNFTYTNEYGVQVDPLTLWYAETVTPTVKIILQL